MMNTMYIGSGYISELLAGKNTKTHYKLLQRFVSGEKPVFNAKASPIDALRTGAILEDRFYEYIEDDYYPQCKVVCDEMDVMTATLDFAKYKKGKVIHFIELKTCNFDDFIKLRGKDIEYIKKNYKNNYNQVQFQLLCSSLNEAELNFLAVYNYDDEENYNRIINENEIIKFTVKRDESVINTIKERAKIFQTIKDYYKK